MKIFLMFTIRLLYQGIIEFICINNFYFFLIVNFYSYCNLLAVSANQMVENEKRHVFLKKLWSMVLHPNVNTVKCALK